MEHREVVRAFVIILYSLTTPAGATRHPSGNHPQNFPNFAGPDRGELAPHGRRDDNYLESTPPVVPPLIRKTKKRAHPRAHNNH